MNKRVWVIEHERERTSPGHSPRNLVDDIRALRDILVERCRAPKTALLGGTDGMPEIHLYFPSCAEAQHVHNCAQSLVNNYRGEFCRVVGYCESAP